MAGEKPRDLDLDSYVPALLTWVNNKYTADSTRIYRRQFGIGIADWRVMAYLGVKELGTGAEMSDFLGMDKAAASRSLRTLTDLGYVELAEQQGRRSRQRLTQSGVRLYNDILVVALEREQALLRGFSTDERADLLRLMHKMHENIPGVMALYSDEKDQQ